MRTTLGIDSEPIGRDRSGNDTFLRGLVAGIAESGQHDLILYGNRFAIEEVLPDVASDTSCSIVQWKKHSNMTWARDAVRRGCDVVIGNYVPPLARSVPVLTIIHDVLWRDYPKLFPWALRHRLELTTALATKISSRIITTADCTARHIATSLGISNDRVVSIGAGGNPAIEALARQVPPSQRASFVLAIGSLHPRKNIRLLARACRDLDMELHVIGAPIWGHDLPAGPEFSTTRWLGHLSDREVADKLAECGVFVHPSLAEGFGMPLVEALRFGTPIIASDIPASREVLGDAALFFSPTDLNGLITCLRLSREPAVRDELAQAATDRQSEISWSSVADRLSQVIRSVVQ